MARLAFVLLVAVALFGVTALSMTQWKVAELHILKSASALKNDVAHTIASTDVAGVLAHLYGVASSVGLPKKNVPLARSVDSSLKRSKGHLAVVLEGAALNEKSQISVDGVVQYDVVASNKEDHATLLSQFFNHAGQSVSIPDAVADLVDGQSLVVSIGSNADLLAQASAAINGKDDSNSVQILIGDKSAPMNAKLFRDLAKSLNAASAASLLDSNTFNLNNEADRIFAQELAALVAFVPQLSSSPALKAAVNDAHPDLFTFVLSGLQLVRKQYGETSPQYRTAWSKVGSVLSQVSHAFDALYGNDATVSVVLLDYETPSAGNKRRGIIGGGGTGAVVNSTVPPPASGVVFPCRFADHETCMAATSNCSNFNGTCTIVSSDPERSYYCHDCVCNPGYGGTDCQYIDISAEFWIILALSVALVVVLIGVSISMAYMDPGTSTLLFRTGQPSRPKSD